MYIMLKRTLVRWLVLLLLLLAFLGLSCRALQIQRGGALEIQKRLRFDLQSLLSILVFTGDGSIERPLTNQSPRLPTVPVLKSAFPPLS